MPRYFSDQEKGERPRSLEMIGEGAWSGIYEHIKDQCGDTQAFWRKAKAEVPEIAEHISWDVETDGWGDTSREGSSYRFSISDIEWHSLAILDLVVFSYHSLESKQIKQQTLRAAINRIFARNGLAYELQEDGEVHRLSSQVLLDALTQSTFNSGDSSLDSLLDDARIKFLDPDQAVRCESLEKLWDAFERINTLEPAKDKKIQYHSAA